MVKGEGTKACFCKICIVPFQYTSVLLGLDYDDKTFFKYQRIPINAKLFHAIRLQRTPFHTFTC